MNAVRTLASVCLVLVAAAQLGCWDAPPLYEGMPEHVEERHVALEGAANFRDLGGYATEDGRTVKWGTFYRSDALAELTASDLETVGELGIRLVCDFRGPKEWQAAPDRVPETDPPEIAHLEIWDPSFDASGFREMLSEGVPDDMDLGQVLVDGNRSFATRFADRYAAMFERLIEPGALPALVHCTAGKDRAGFASALILRALGVPLDTVYEDYLLTNHYTAERIEKGIFMAELFSFWSLDGERLRPLLGVERRFLEAAFEGIDAEYGDFDAFRREALKVSDVQLAALRELGLD